MKTAEDFIKSKNTSLTNTNIRDINNFSGNYLIYLLEEYRKEILDEIETSKNDNIAQAVLLVLAQIKHNEECGKDNKFTISEVTDIIKRYILSPVDDVKLSHCPECGYATINGHIRGCQFYKEKLTEIYYNDEKTSPDSNYIIDQDDEEWHEIHDEINEARRNGEIE